MGSVRPSGHGQHPGHVGRRPRPPEPGRRIRAVVQPGAAGPGGAPRRLNLQAPRPTTAATATKQMGASVSASQGVSALVDPRAGVADCSPGEALTPFDAPTAVPTAGPSAAGGGSVVATAGAGVDTAGAVVGGAVPTGARAVPPAGDGVGAGWVV